jgi:hypothetical protein
MLNGKIYKVFVSSTFEDLREERSEVQKTLLQMDCLPVGMELFPSSDEETWRFIQGQIDDSDYYIVLIGGKYGSISSNGISFTEREYDYAQERGKPTLGFIHANPDALPLGKSENRAKLKAQLNAFMRKVSKTIKKFLSSHDLAAAVALSMNELLTYRPATGFVRANVPAKLNASEALENVRPSLIGFYQMVKEISDILRNTTPDDTLEIEQIGLDLSYASGLFTTLFRTHPNISRVDYRLLMLTGDAEKIDERYEEVRRWCHTVQTSSMSEVISV